MAIYLGNNLDRSYSFERVFKVALRTDQSELGQEFVKAMTNKMRNYALKNNGKLPRSFKSEALNGLYLNLKTSQVKISDELEEFILFTMDKLGMDAEVVDICDNKAMKTDVHTYYLSEALLRMKFSDRNYTEVLD